MSKASKVKEVKVGEFVRVQGNDLKDHGVVDGSVVYLAGDAIVSVSEDDPYMLRRVFVAAYVQEGHILIKEKPFIIDGKRLKACSSKEQEAMLKIKKEDFGDKEEESVAETVH